MRRMNLRLEETKIHVVHVRVSRRDVREDERRELFTKSEDLN